MSLSFNPDFRTVFQNLPGAYLLLSPSLEVLEASRLYLEISKCNRENLIGRTLFVGLPTDRTPAQSRDFRELRISFEKVLQGQSSDSLEVHSFDPLSKTSTEHYWRIRNSSIVDEQGKVIYLVHQIEDVTGATLERLQEQTDNQNLRDANRNIQKKLTDFENDFHTITEALPQMVFTADAEGQVNYVNRRWCEYTGIHCARTWNQALHPDDAALTHLRWEEALHTKESYEIEYRLRRASDQAYRWHLGRALPLKNQNGEIIKWIGTCTDIHEQKLNRDYLKASGQEFRVIAEAIPQLVWRTNFDGSADYFNQRFLDYVGYSAEEVLGWGWSEVIHPEDRQRVIEEFARCRAAENPVSVEFRVRGVGGAYRWFLSLGNPFRDPNGDVIKYYGTWTDIDESKKAKELAEMANRAKSAFLANMSHEIRTPLGVIRGFADILEENPEFDPETKKWISTIRRNAIHLNSLVDELLDLSKIESGYFEVEKIKFSLTHLLEDVSSLLTYKASEKGLVLRILSQGKIPDRITSDPTRLKQILVNLVGNAIKFTDYGGVEVKVRTVPGRDRKSNLEISVRDSGIGIRKEQMDRLFQPFMQADSSTTRKFGGTGLGLYISKRLAEALGGGLKLIQSDAGAGSTFCLTIECGELNEEDFVSAQNSKSISTQSELKQAKLEGLKVLVVEDAPDNQVLVNRILKMAGAEVVLANNGVEGVEQALKGDQDVILMDIQMPELDGYSATQRLREAGYKKPIIALTAHAMKQEREKCLRSGFDDHLSKPIQRDILVEVISQYGRDTNSLRIPGAVTSSSPELFKGSLPN